MGDDIYFLSNIEDIEDIDYIDWFMENKDYIKYNLLKSKKVKTVNSDIYFAIFKSYFIEEYNNSNDTLYILTNISLVNFINLIKDINVKSNYIKYVIRPKNIKKSEINDEVDILNEMNIRSNQNLYHKYKLKEYSTNNFDEDKISLLRQNIKLFKKKKVRIEFENILVQNNLAVKKNDDLCDKINNEFKKNKIIKCKSKKYKYVGHRKSKNYR